MTRLTDAVRLPRDFFERPVLDVAPDLLGCVVRHGDVAVRLTEVEAYAGTRDPGSHAFRGPTPRTQVMFGEAGHLYVYFTYGMHWCANLVCGPEGEASAVLLRAGEVVAGETVVAERRPGVVARDRARGPARLTRTLALDRAQDGLDVCAPDSPVVVSAPSEPHEATVRTGPRVGVSGPGGDGTAYPWRFWLEGEPTVSPYRPGVPRRRR
ncbi:DNA-3-methyladenine glycosylase [Knoellia remsis]|uniref:Putative 3-methyladenine DNA glycosylase n=1 Tax=Knoellia remsis TaxID=407159 RepID=A0A2T0V0U1_9MICO|nr:DNA-3-methyladenine glycosylase [Knoellia remsis]PRY63805.1 DNA-3-methyladenine glycosylase [Knoellia remsis]